MIGFKGPAQPSPTLGDALNAGYGYLEVRCLGCGSHQTVALDIVRRPKTTPIYELERYMRCKGLLRSPGLSLQAQPPDRAAHHQDHGERSAVEMSARRAVRLARLRPSSTQEFPLCVRNDITPLHRAASSVYCRIAKQNSKRPACRAPAFQAHRVGSPWVSPSSRSGPPSECAPDAQCLQRLSSL